ncbi:MAG: serine/threonine protein kinase [Candidatus Marinimicrobia bacterium]|nr:serine/threonine protein kinase [Candidatus Neomarinimicrobiota bacterium]
MTLTIIAASLFALTFIVLIIVLVKKRTTDTINNKYSNLVKYSEEGGMAIIYKCFNKETKTWCILKVLRQKQINDRDAVESLFREADILIKIKEMIPDANVPEVYDRGEIQDKFSKLPFIELEYIKGKTSLEDYLRKNGKLSVEEADELIGKLLPAIKGAHKLKFIHRDIKPSNILLRDGKIDQPVLIDFGIAKEEGGKKTETGLFLAPKYMAPEQADPNRPDLTIFVDNYILGILWFELLTGDVPFTDKNPLKLAEMHRTKDIRPFVQNSVPEERQEIISKLLEKEPENRPNIDEVAKLLNVPIEIKNNIEDRKPPVKIPQKSNNLLILFLFMLVVLLGATTFYLYKTGKLDGIKNVSLLNVNFNFENLDDKIFPIDPVKINSGEFLEVTKFNHLFEKINEIEIVPQVCEILSRKINQNDPNRIFFIVDPSDMEIIDNYFHVRQVLVVDLSKNTITLEKNYKMALFFKNAIFAISNNIIQK